MPQIPYTMFLSMHNQCVTSGDYWNVNTIWWNGSITNSWQLCHINPLVPQIKYPLGGSSKKGSHVNFLLYIFWVIPLFDINVVLLLPWWPDFTIVQSDVTMVVPWQLSTGSKHNHLFCYCPLVGILFKVLRITLIKASNRKIIIPSILSLSTSWYQF